MAQVVGAISTRCDPKHGLLKAQNFPGRPFFSADEDDAGDAYALFDCTAARACGKKNAPGSIDDGLAPEIAGKNAAHLRAYRHPGGGRDEWILGKAAAGP